MIWFASESHCVFFHSHFDLCSTPYLAGWAGVSVTQAYCKLGPAFIWQWPFKSSNASSLLQGPPSEICRIRVQILVVFASPECHWLQGGCRILAKSWNWPRIFSDSLMLLFIWCYHQELTVCFMLHFTFKLHKGYLLCRCYIVCKKDAHKEMKKHWLPLGFPVFSIHFPKQPRDYFLSKKNRNENPISWHLCMAFWSLTHQVCYENGQNKKASWYTKVQYSAFIFCILVSQSERWVHP